MSRSGPPDDAFARAAVLAALGHRGRLPRGAAAGLSEAAAGDPDARVRATALGALARAGSPSRAVRAWRAATGDPDVGVRRRAAELAPSLARRGAVSASPLVGLLADPDVTVVEAAAWSLGELGDATAETVAALAAVTTRHADPLAREAAVAALGAIGDPGGLDAVLVACGDVATVRRRAVLALAPFAGPAVDAALERARGDRDWQVRQAAEDLLPAGRAGGQ